jgi:hypothetical protein
LASANCVGAVTCWYVIFDRPVLRSLVRFVNLLGLHQLRGPS